MNFMNQFLVKPAKKLGFFFGNRDDKIIDGFGPDGISN